MSIISKYNCKKETLKKKKKIQAVLFLTLVLTFFLDMPPQVREPKGKKKAPPPQKKPKRKKPNGTTSN